ncbi:ECF transporter S component [Candidatus Caldatribacterium sp.]|uniref:ECF transporter S component n=1 Tax=Candidatus Caldatribacterium sp. TaxID=2282143 RepID=UPI0038730E07
MKTRDITVSALLAASAIVLGATGLGFVPVPTPAGRATIMHIPTILAGVLEGPVIGGLVGLIFGLYSFLTTAVPFLRDPLIAIVPRILIGVVAALIFKATRKSSFAAVAGTLTNTGGVLGLAVLRGYLPGKVALSVAATHGIPEVIVATILVVLIVRGIRKYFS